MDLMLPIVRLVLLFTFAAAGGTKLKDSSGTARTLTAFGVKERWSARLVTPLSLAELLIAGALLWTPAVWFAAWGAAMLLIVFLAGILYNLSRGRRPPCNCFGELSAKPIGALTVTRNLLLVACAIALLGDGAGSREASFLQFTRAFARPGALAWAIAFVALMLAAQLYLTMQVLQQQGRILQRLGAIDGLADSSPTEAVAGPVIVPGLAVGSAAPAFALQNLLGEEVTLRSLLGGGRPLLMLFMSPGCGPCVALVPEAAQWVSDPRSEVEIVVISEGTIEENLAKGGSLDARMILLQLEQEISHAYHAWGTPAAVVVNPHGRIASGVAQGAEAIRTLLADANRKMVRAPQSGDPASRNGHRPIAEIPALRVGDPVSPMQFAGLDGAAIELETEPGRSLVLLFWNPGCGFCQRMLDDLRGWESNPPQDAPSLLVISTGSREENLAMGLRSPVALDGDSIAARAFGTGGTPTAVLIDAAGRVASEVVAGAEAVFALVGGRQVIRA
jgi:thiol-disulfide isomerase/thioredoxin